MTNRDRREFLANVGRGVVVAGLGQSLSQDLGLSRALAAEPVRRLDFGSAEPLVSLMQDTPINRLIPELVKRLASGTTLQQLLAAGVLANARTFGGEDYIGFHSLMALAPAYHMGNELPESQRPLPALKVLYRNTNRMQEKGGSRAEVLHPVRPVHPASDVPLAQQISQAVNSKDVQRAEQLLAFSAEKSAAAAYSDLLPTVEESTEVHRTVLAYRAWDLLDLVGPQHAHTLLRQSLHYCAQNCREASHPTSGARAILPKLLDQYRLVEKQPGTKVAEDGWVLGFSETIFHSTPARAADAVAAALAEGIRPDDIAEAIALAVNQLVLRDPGRNARQAQPNKPVGSVHGDSTGVHACDSANAWRNIARVCDHRNAVASLILSGYQAALDRSYGGAPFESRSPWPYSEQLSRFAGKGGSHLLAEMDDAIRHQDQARACAAVHAYGMFGGTFLEQPPGPVIDRLRECAITQDGALHAEKYFRTATEEFSRTRPRFRWRHLVALARVSASEYGQPAPGVAESKSLLKLA